MNHPTNDYPLVSCLMLVGHHSNQDIIAAIDCFTKQTYPNKELIIVNNVLDRFRAISLVIPSHPGVVLFDTQTYLTAGMARNYAISAANGQFLAQFDADCWHCQDRLSAQMATMAHNDAQCSVLESTMAYSYQTNHFCELTNKSKLIPNSMVWVRPRDLDYDNVSYQEELSLLYKLRGVGCKLIALAKPHLMCKIYPAVDGNWHQFTHDHELVKQIIGQRSQFYPTTIKSMTE